MGDGHHEAKTFEDAEAHRIEILEAKIASPELQGLDDSKYWPRMALMDQLFDLRHAKLRREIEDNWVRLEALVGHPLAR